LGFRWSTIRARVWHLEVARNQKKISGFDLNVVPLGGKVGGLQVLGKAFLKVATLRVDLGQLVMSDTGEPTRESRSCIQIAISR